MTRDELLILGVVASFAALVTSHLALIAGLAVRRPRWRSLVAFAAAPLAPYWGFQAGLHVRSAVWVASAIAYLVLRALA